MIPINASFGGLSRRGYNPGASIPTPTITSVTSGQTWIGRVNNSTYNPYNSGNSSLVIAGTDLSTINSVTLWNGTSSGGSLGTITAQTNTSITLTYGISSSLAAGNYYIRVTSSLGPVATSATTLIKVSSINITSASNYEYAGATGYRSYYAMSATSGATTGTVDVVNGPYPGQVTVVLAGGGAGGGSGFRSSTTTFYRGGGGGAGLLGFVNLNGTLATGSSSFTLGAGGAGGVGGGSSSNGASSTFQNGTGTLYTAAGGGRGGGSTAPSSGGSGGGGRASTTTGGSPWASQAGAAGVSPAGSNLATVYVGNGFANSNGTSGGGAGAGTSGGATGAFNGLAVISASPTLDLPTYWCNGGTGTSSFSSTVNGTTPGSGGRGGGASSSGGSNGGNGYSGGIFLHIQI
jgi:hypothetical protein